MRSMPSVSIRASAACSAGRLAWMSVMTATSVVIEASRRRARRPARSRPRPWDAWPSERASAPCDRLWLLATGDHVRAARAIGLRVLAAAAGTAGLLGVLVRWEDLPRRAVRIVHPYLVLARVATGRVHLVERRQPGGDEAVLCSKHVGRRRHLDTGVVERAQARALAGVEREVERRLGDRELRVAGLALLRRDAEQRLVEPNRALDVGDGQREVRTQDSHGTTLLVRERHGTNPTKAKIQAAASTTRAAVGGAANGGASA